MPITNPSEVLAPEAEVAFVPPLLTANFPPIDAASKSTFIEVPLKIKPPLVTRLADNVLPDFDKPAFQKES